MAVLTEITEEDIKKIIEDYPQFENMEFVSLTPIAEGSSNTNYILCVKKKDK